MPSGAFFVASGGCRLAVEAGGEGVPVVFLHAGVADRRMWRDTMVSLAASGLRVRAIAYDRRGFGATEPVDEDYSQAGDLGSVLDATCGGAPPVLVGCSQGGRIAIDFALVHPSRVRALVLVAPAVSGAPAVERFPAPIRELMAALDRADAAGDLDRVNALEAHAWLDGPMQEEGRVGGAARALFLAMNGGALRAPPLGRAEEPPPAWHRIERIGVPVLVAWGDLDFPHLVARCRELVRRLPDGRALELAGTAHLPSLEAPGRFGPALVAFCTSLSH